MITTLIATIIHMNMGYALPEALGRGLVSAVLVGAVAFVVQLVFMAILYLAGRR